MEGLFSTIVHHLCQIEALPLLLFCDDSKVGDMSAARISLTEYPNLKVGLARLNSGLRTIDIL